jgi:hypothetical protein
VTLSPTDYRAWRAEVAQRDRAYADGYRAGLADAQAARERDRLMALAAVGALLVLGRRLHPHPLVGFLLGAVLVVVLSPVLYLVLAAELTVRCHRRHRSWQRTAAYGASWLLGALLVLLGFATRDALALAGVIVLVAAWTILPAALARRRRDQGTTPPPGEPTDLFTDADRTLPPLTERRHRARRYMR